MSIQLDGQVTYHPNRQAGAQPPAGKAGRLLSTFPPGPKLPAVGPCISWNGSWHYSQKQTRGSNAACGFKYFFVGPEIEERPPGLAASPGGADRAVGETNSSVAASRASSNPRSVSGISGQKSDPRQAGVASIQHEQQVLGTQGGGAAAAKSAATPAPVASSRAINTSSAAVTASANSSRGGAGTRALVALTPEQMTLYGPCGDGRLPSGRWSGQFAVKARGQEFLVSESFVLEFGSGKLPRPPGFIATPTLTAGAATTTSGGLLAEQRVNGDKVQVPKPGDPAGAGTVTKATTGVAAAADAVGEVLAAPPAPAASSQVAPTVGPTAADTTAVASAPPVVRVSGWGENRYGEFTLTGGHERATGRLDLTRFYYDKPKPRPTPGAATGGTSSISHQKKRRPLPPGAPPPQDPGPSLAERRTKRVRHPAQRLLDDELVSLSHHAETSGSISKRKSEATAAAAAAAAATTSTGPAGSLIADGVTSEASCGFGTIAAVPEVAGGKSGESRRGSGTKARKTRDRERDLLMEQNRRARRKAQQQMEVLSGSSGSVNGGGAGTVVGAARAGTAIGAIRAVPSSGTNSAYLAPEGAAVAELAQRARAGREALAGADLSALIGTDNENDLVLKEALLNMAKEQAGLEAELQAAAAAAATAAFADTEIEAFPRAAEAPNNGSGGGGGGGSSSSRAGRNRGSRIVPQERWRSMFLDEDTGEIYEGGWRAGKRHGRGMCVYANQNIYEGDWRDGKEYGFGRIMRGRNRVLIFEGEFADGKLCGRGRHSDESGEVYDGEWKDNARHGKGIYRFATTLDVSGITTALTTATVGSPGGERGGGAGVGSAGGVAAGAGATALAGAGSSLADNPMLHPFYNVGVVAVPGGGVVITTTYDGEFKDNLRSGRGLLTWPGGSYDGDWLHDHRHGRGVLRTDDGFVYDGGWVEGLPEGRGICIHQDGQRYEGVFRGGKKEGRGTLAFANGASYEGRFRDDAIDGQGMLQIPKPVKDDMGGWMIPIQFQSDIERIHVKAGFDKGGL